MILNILGPDKLSKIKFCLLTKHKVSKGKVRVCGNRNNEENWVIKAHMIKSWGRIIYKNQGKRGKVLCFRNNFFLLFSTPTYHPPQKGETKANLWHESAIIRINNRSQQLKLMLKKNTTSKDIEAIVKVQDRNSYLPA